MEWRFALCINFSSCIYFHVADFLEILYFSRLFNHFLLTQNFSLNKSKQWIRILLLLLFGLYLIDKLLRVFYCRWLWLDLDIHDLRILLVSEQKAHWSYGVVEIVEFIVEFLVVWGEIIIQLHLKAQSHGLHIVHAEAFCLEFTILVELEQTDHVGVLEDAVILGQIQCGHDAFHRCGCLGFKLRIETSQTVNTQCYVVVLHKLIWRVAFLRWLLFKV